eukprot:scaffold65_cov172-Skeletonema_menzelii.AAC.2
MDDFSWGTTRVTTDDSNSSTTSDELDEEQGSGGGGTVVDSNKASSTDTSVEGGGDSFEVEAEESNKASTDKVSEDEELGCVKAEEPKASLAEALGESTSEISVAAVNDFNKVGSTGCLGEGEERMDSFIYASLDSSANQLNDGAEAEEQREIEILTVEKNPSGARAVLQRGGSILKGKIAVAFGSK